MTMNGNTYMIPLGRAGKYGTLQADTTKFSDAINAYVYEYGLRQVLNDAMADKKDEDGNDLPDDQIVAKAQKRLDALYAGTIRTRTAGEAEPADPNEAELYRLAKEVIHAGYKAARFYDQLPKGTKNKMLAVANMRRRQRGLEELDTLGDVIRVFLETSAEAPKLRKQAERNVRERLAVDPDTLGV